MFNKGADKIVKLCKEKISPNENEVSKKETALGWR